MNGFARWLIPGLVVATALAAGAGCVGGGDPGDDIAAPGRSRYRFHCGACHGKAGLGSKHLFPPLAGSPWATGPVDVPIRVVLHGMEGRLVVHGDEYLNKMPGLGLRLKDAEVAEILTYVRSSWGNVASPVAATDVARVRAETADRRDPYRVEEMEAFRRRVAEDAPAVGGQSPDDPPPADRDPAAGSR